MRLDHYAPPLETISVKAHSLQEPDREAEEEQEEAPRTLGPFCPKCGTPRKQRQPFCRYCYYSFLPHI
jgi:hypothetical protein